MVKRRQQGIIITRHCDAVLKLSKKSWMSVARGVQPSQPPDNSNTVVTDYEIHVGTER